jgi:hypothetical protein
MKTRRAAQIVPAVGIVLLGAMQCTAATGTGTVPGSLRSQGAFVHQPHRHNTPSSVLTRRTIQISTRIGVEHDGVMMLPTQIRTSQAATALKVSNTMGNINNNELPPSTIEVERRRKSKVKQAQRQQADKVEASDRRKVLTWLGSCVTAACAVSTYEDFDVTQLHPYRGALRRVGVFATRHESDTASALSSLSSNVNDSSFGIDQIGAATRGLGSNKNDRLAVRSSYTEETAPLFSAADLEEDEPVPRPWEPDAIRSYNEIMEDHRNQNVPRWRSQYKEEVGTNNSPYDDPETIVKAVTVIYRGIQVLDKELKPAAQDYDWEGLKEGLSSSLWRHDLEVACSTLLYAKLRHETDTTSKAARREEIGLDWGSCAWRHCGALADIQEVVAELYNSVGMLEPYECLFCLDIAERGLRDILAVVPPTYRQQTQQAMSYKLPMYTPYQSQGDAYDGMTSLGIDGGSGDAGLSNNLGNPQFLNILNMLKNDLS